MGGNEHLKFEHGEIIEGPISGPVRDQLKNLTESIGQFTSLVVRHSGEEGPAVTVSTSKKNGSRNSAAEITGAVTVNGALMVRPRKGGFPGIVNVGGEILADGDITALRGENHRQKYGSSGISLSSLADAITRIDHQLYTLVTMLGEAGVVNPNEYYRRSSQ